MNIRVLTLTMGNVANSNKDFNPVNADNWTESIVPLSKYYDIYNPSLTQKSSKLGDGIKETIFNGDITWYSNVASSFFDRNYPFVVRGGHPETWNSNVRYGIYRYNRVSGVYTLVRTSRPVLTVSRNMPWLNNN